MDLETALSSRRSVRDYTDEPVDEATIRQLIAAAVLAPSATNLQPWTFTVVRDRELLDRLSDATKAFLLGGGFPDGPGAEQRRARLADPEYPPRLGDGPRVAHDDRRDRQDRLRQVQEGAAVGGLEEPLRVADPAGAEAGRGRG